MTRCATRFAYIYNGYNYAILQKNIFNSKACFAGNADPARRAFVVF